MWGSLEEVYGLLQELQEAARKRTFCLWLCSRIENIAALKRAVAACKDISKGRSKRWRTDAKP